MQFKIEGFDSNLHVDAEFALCDTGSCDSKKFFMILHMTVICVFDFAIKKNNGSEIG